MYKDCKALACVQLNVKEVGLWRTQVARGMRLYKRVLKTW